VDNSLSTELSASKYYRNTYAQESVDRSGPKSVDKSAVAAWRQLAATPPLAGLAGATVAALNTYKKNFLKKF
jgi:hypothetical protein